MAAEEKTADVVELLVEAFPEMSCLRCGHGFFTAVTDLNVLGTRSANPDSVSKLILLGMTTEGQESGVSLADPVVTLACERCGHLEHHLTGLLQSAKKPIPQRRRS